MSTTIRRPGMAPMAPVLLVLVLSFLAVDGWLMASASERATLSSSRRHATSNDGEPDLFDYFDPLLSPHAYPNGISPDHKPNRISDSIPLPVIDEVPKQPFASQPEPDALASPQRPSVETPHGTMHAQFLERQLQLQMLEQNRNDNYKAKEKDLFEYFDPLLSPHAYPNGISPDQAPQIHNINQKTASLQAVPSPRPLQPVASAGPSSSSPARLGILLMDHGSRSAASNDRLSDLARLYQQTLSLDGNHVVVVEAAHMEIATPSIPEGLQALLDHGVDEIVCHPYFLSPGRHVREDIPQIVQRAIIDMDIRIPVRTTDPVGSNAQLMIGAIHSLVRETSVVLREDIKKRI